MLIISSTRERNELYFSPSLASAKITTFRLQCPFLQNYKDCSTGELALMPESVHPHPGSCQGTYMGAVTVPESPSQAPAAHHRGISALTAMTSRHREASKGQCLGSSRWRAQPSTQHPLKVGGLKSQFPLLQPSCVPAQTPHCTPGCEARPGGTGEEAALINVPITASAAPKCFLCYQDGCLPW